MVTVGCRMHAGVMLSLCPPTGVVLAVGGCESRQIPGGPSAYKGTAKRAHV